MVEEDPVPPVQCWKGQVGEKRKLSRSHETNIPHSQGPGFCTDFNLWMLMIWGLVRAWGAASQTGYKYEQFYSTETAVRS